MRLLGCEPAEWPEIPFHGAHALRRREMVHTVLRSSSPQVEESRGGWVHIDHDRYQGHAGAECRLEATSLLRTVMKSVQTYLFPLLLLPSLDANKLVDYAFCQV